MISSSKGSVCRGLDAMLIAYSLLEDHPASARCDAFIRARTGWFTTALTLLEVKTILTKVYGVAPPRVTEQLAPFAQGLIDVFGLDVKETHAAMTTADALGIDLTDAVLLRIAQREAAVCLATDDRKLIHACGRAGIATETPIDDALRREMLEWEAGHLYPKGLARILRRIHEWLGQRSASIAEEFWSSTGGGSYLP